MRLALFYDPRKYWLERGKHYIEYAENSREVSVLRENFVRELRKLGFSSALEIGCGYGGALKFVRGKFPKARLEGIDFSKTMIENALNYLKGTGISARVADANKLPFATGSFDVVFSVTVLLHVPKNEIRAVADEMKRASGKYIVLVEPDAKIQNWFVKLFHSRHVFFHDYHELFSDCTLVSKKSLRQSGMDDAIFVFEKQ